MNAQSSRSVVADIYQPPVFPYAWASAWGQDEFGLWQTFTINHQSQTFRWIPPGKFTMGSPINEPKRFDRERQHEVTLSQGFWLAETACTQGLWNDIMGGNPSHFKDEKNWQELPVESVSWEDVQTFLENIKEHVLPDCLPRLPTEAQWEYACRAGTSTSFSFGEILSLEEANYDSDNPYHKGKKEPYLGKTVSVFERHRNTWGLYQMHGNVWEWCHDWYDENYYSSSPIVDPGGPESGDARVLRGGAFSFNGGNLRSAYRIRGGPTGWDDGIGFRFALVNQL